MPAGGNFRERTYTNGKSRLAGRCRAGRKAKSRGENESEKSPSIAPTTRIEIGRREEDRRSQNLRINRRRRNDGSVASGPVRESVFKPDKLVADLLFIYGRTDIIVN